MPPSQEEGLGISHLPKFFHREVLHRIEFRPPPSRLGIHNVQITENVPVYESVCLLSRGRKKKVHLKVGKVCMYLKYRVDQLGT